MLALAGEVESSSNDSSRFLNPAFEKTARELETRKSN
jgi:hypothetical protein